MARNQYGKDMERQAEASRRYRARHAEQRQWLVDLAGHLEVEPHMLISSSAAAVAELLRTERAASHQPRETP